MQDLPLDIISFAERPDLLNEQRLSVVQKTILKALYGLPLSDDELEIYQSGTARVAYEQREQNEMTLIAGRRGGKTTIAAIIAIYEACRKHGLPPGEQGCVMLLASTIPQSGMAFKYIVNYFRRSPLLDSRCVKITKSEIFLDNGVVIACHPSSHHGVRGRSIIAVICDEIAFWPYGEEAANPAGEILSALRPAMATLCNTKIVKISTPFAKAGILWDEYQRRSELDYAVWQATTFEMNPSVTPEKVKRQRCQNEEEYQREYLAQFTDSINSWIDSEILDPCIVRGRHEIPPNLPLKMLGWGYGYNIHLLRRETYCRGFFPKYTY
jgi:terminase large subunit-like protein